MACLIWIKMRSGLVANMCMKYATENRTMYRCLLIPVDGSAAANAGLQEAIRFAGGSKAVIRIVHVVDRLSFLQNLQPVQIIEEMLVGMERAGRDILASARSQAAKARVPVEVAMRKSTRGSVADTLVKEAERAKADLIVMGIHAQNPWRVVLGGTASGVLRYSKCPVLLVPPLSPQAGTHPSSAADRQPRHAPRPFLSAGRTGIYKRILVPIDGSAAAKASLREALRLSRANSQSAIRLLHVAGEMPMLHGMRMSFMVTVCANARRLGAKLLKDAKAAVGKNHRRVTASLREAAGDDLAQPVIEEACRWKADVIVMGTHGRRGISRLVLGSGAESVVNASTIPVLLVRA